MSVRLGPYHEYKDSGVPWLGEMPRHWALDPGYSAFRQKQHKNTRMLETTVLSLSYGRIVVKPPEKLHGLVPASFETYQVVYPGNIIIRPTDLQNDWNSLRVGIARDSGIITSAYLCLRTIGPLIPDYGYLLLHAYDLKKTFYGMGSGLRQNLDFTDLKRMPVLIPPREEQSAIVRFLAHADHRINRLIHAKQRLIELLNEQKQAIIHRAVTRGLDPNVRLKPSGIEYMGNFPEHWTIRPLKRWVKINKRVLPETTDPNYEFRYLDIGAVGTGFLVEQPERMRFGAAPSRARRILRPGDTIISTVRTYLKAVYFVSDSADDLVASTGFAVLMPEPQVVAEFLSFVIQSNSFVDRVTAHSVGIAYPAIPETRLGAFPVVVPPTQAEQLALVEHIRTETRVIDEALRRAHREIELIREYRTRLIADVVTGKLDVRGVKLPAVEDGEFMEDMDDGYDAEAEEISEGE